MENCSTSYSEEIVRRFWAKVNKTDTCWLWTASLSGGYGRFGLGGHGRNVYAHRLSWKLAYGEVPHGKDVLHNCDTPCCVRPSHLFLGTDVDNARDRMEKGRNAIPIRKLTEAQKVQIKQDLRANRTIAIEYGVSHMLISYVKRGIKR